MMRLYSISRVSLMVTLLFLSISNNSNAFLFPNEPNRNSKITTTASTNSNTALFFLNSGGNRQQQQDNNYESNALSKKKKEAVPYIETIQSQEQFLDFISSSDDENDFDDERLTIVKFHAAWCKSCQKYNVMFRKFALQMGDLVYYQEKKENILTRMSRGVKGGSSDKNDKKNKGDREAVLVQKGVVRLADVEFGANLKLCRTLKIKQLPYIHMYRKSKGKVTEFVCSPNSFQRLINQTMKHLETDEKEFLREMRLSRSNSTTKSGKADGEEGKDENDDLQKQQQQTQDLKP